MTLDFSQVDSFSYADSASGSVVSRSDQLAVVEVSFSREMNYMDAGNAAVLVFPSISLQEITGKVLSIVTESNAVTLRIGFDPVDSKAALNEAVEVSVQKTTREMNCVVPRTAVFEDYSGSYVYLIDVKDGIWGRSYYVKRTDIKIAYQDAQRIACQRAQGFEEPIVIASDIPLTDGAQVRIYP